MTLKVSFKVKQGNYGIEEDTGGRVETGKKNKKKQN